MKWSSADDNDEVFTCCLRLKDRSEADKFVKIVQEFSKLSLHDTRTEMDKTERVYSVITNTESIAEETVPHPSEVKPFTTPPTTILSSESAVYEYGPINEPMPSENDIDTDDAVKSEALATAPDDHDNVTLSHVPISDDLHMPRSSTPTNDCLHNEDTQPEILKDVKKAFEAGMAQNGVPYSEKKPANLPVIKSMSQLFSESQQVSSMILTVVIVKCIYAYIANHEVNS